MPGILARFKRSPSTSSTDATFPPDRQETQQAPRSGSHFVEELSTPPSSARELDAAMTPKLTLTEEGASSPRSFESSPGRRNMQEMVSPRSDLSIHTAPALGDALSPPGNELARARTETRSRRSGSIISRLKHERSPTLSPTLLPSDRRDRRSRRMSQSSGKVRSIAASIGKKLGGDESDSEEDSDLDHDDLDVTGFAVASNRRNQDFHAMFPAVDEGDYLIEDYGCALSKDILVQGRIYVSENHICFHANIFGWVTDLVIPFNEIKAIERKNTALVIPNAIGVSTAKDKYTFASFISRDTTYDVMSNIWRLCNPGAVMSTTSFHPSSRPTSVVDEPVEPERGHGATQCACGREGKHYAETALEATLPSTPEKIYNLMCNSGWHKTWLVEDQKLRELEMSDWRPVKDSLLTRSMSYIKPLNGSIGPKQTKCHIVDEQEHFDLDSYVSFLTTTRTPDVPSGGVFSVKTRTCLMWAGGNSTKMVVTSMVEWTGKSWVKGIIDKSAIDGQKQYHDDLVRGMRAHIKEHPSEFGRQEVEEEEEKAPTEAEAYAAETKRKRHEEDLGYIQGGIDKVVSGVGSIGSGIGAVVRATTDILVSEDGPKGKEIAMALVIALLLVSNLWTYVSFSRAAPARLARRAEREGDLSEAVRLLLERVSPADEVHDLVRVLDQVEARAKALRGLLQ